MASKFEIRDMVASVAIREQVDAVCGDGFFVRTLKAQSASEHALARAYSLDAYDECILSVDQLAELVKLDALITEVRANRVKFLSLPVLESMTMFSVYASEHDMSGTAQEYSLWSTVYLAEYDKQENAHTGKADTLRNAKYLAGLLEYQSRLSIRKTSKTGKAPPLLLGHRWSVPFARDGVAYLVDHVNTEKYSLLDKDESVLWTSDQSDISSRLTSRSGIRKFVYVWHMGVTVTNEQGETTVYAPGTQAIGALFAGLALWKDIDAGGIGKTGQLCVDLGEIPVDVVELVLTDEQKAQAKRDAINAKRRAKRAAVKAADMTQEEMEIAAGDLAA